MAIDLDVHGNTKPLEAAVQAAINRIRRQPIKITVDDKGATQPLGNMRRAADEFSKSMEAANARILAFGASMAIINGVADAFKGMVRNLVEVEKSLADINVVMGLSAQNLERFSDGLFKVAKETGAAFKIAADAATEYARQGLGVEESLKRTRDALVLTRLTGMDSAEAVKSLTAAMNTYGKQIKDTTQLVSKFAAVDVQFAVSAEDFADAISRTGQAAKSAGVDIDELIGMVTSAQQQTARGGAVIGNALKTIFTKTGRTDTLNQLENLGIAVRDLEGKTVGAKRILTDLANTFDQLSEAQKAQITQTMGGLFHINILKAVLSDAAKENGILARATQISSGATDEAIQKNEQLRKTMSAMATETGLAIKELSVQIGELMLAPGMEKILNAVKSVAEGANNLLGDGESAGSKFANGFLKGLGNIITGPGLVVLSAVFIKLFMTAAKFTKESLTSLIGVTSEAQKQKAIQTSLVALIGQNAALGKEMLRTDISRTEKEKILLGLLQAQTAEANKLNAISKQLASTLYTRGYGPGLTQGRRRAYGHIPNFADPERSQAARGGYAAGSIRSMNMPGEGPVIYNSAETVKNFSGFKQPAIMPPQSSKAGKNYQQAFGSIHGFDPYAAGGFIPNFNKKQAYSTAKKKPTTEEIRKINAQNNSVDKLNGRIINPGGSQFILITGDQSGGDVQTDFYGGALKNGTVTVYDSINKAMKNQWAGDKFYKINVPSYGLGAVDKNKIKGASVKELDDKFQNLAIEQTTSIGQSFLGKENYKDVNALKAQAKATFNQGSFNAVAGSTFESAMGAMMEANLFQDYSARTGTSLIDLPYSPRLWDLFGVKGGKGKKGGEVKGNLTTKLQASAAEKFYKILGQGAAAFQYLKGESPDHLQDKMEVKYLDEQGNTQTFKGTTEQWYNKQGLQFSEKTDVAGQTYKAPGFLASGYIPNFAANSWESEPKWKWSMNPDYIAFQKKKNQEELNKRISKFGNSNISLTGKYSGNLPIARITDPQTGTYTDFTYGKGSGETVNSTSIIYSSRGKQDQKGGAFRNFGILGDFTSKQGGKDRSIYSDFDQINMAAGKSPWAMVLRAFPQLKQRIKPGMVTSGEMNIGYDTLPFNSLRSLKMQINKWVKQNGLKTFLDYSKANLGFNEKNAILGGTSSGDFFSIGGLRTRMLTRRDKNYLNDSKVGFAASGYVPNFANPLSDAIGREKAAGVPVSQIRVGSHSALMSKGNPLGLGVTNTYDEPNGLRDVFGANGFVPNYAEGFTRSDVNISGRNFSAQDKLVEKLNRRLKAYIEKFKAGEINQKQLNDGIERLSRRTKDQAAAIETANKVIRKSITTREKLNAMMTRASTAFQGSAIGGFSKWMGKSFSGNAGMAMMMGAPMAAGFLQDGNLGSTGVGRASYIAGGGLTGAASGAMMASMIAPMLGPAAPLVVGVGALVGAVHGWISASQENTKALKEKKEREAKQQQQSAAQAFSSIIQGGELSRKISSTNISKVAQSRLGLGPESSVSDALKKSAEKYQMPASLKTMTDELLGTKYENPSWSGYMSEQQIDELRGKIQSENIYRLNKKYPQILDKAESELSNAEKKLIGSTPDLANARRSIQYQKQSKEFMGLPMMADAPQATAVRQREADLQKEKIEARGEIIDFLMENETKESFAVNFGEKGTGYLNKTQYGNLLKGKEVDVGGKIGKQTLPEEAIRSELVTQADKIESDFVNARKEELKAIILRVNKEKAMRLVQQETFDRQMEIKKESAALKNLYKTESSVHGKYLLEKRQTQLKYLEALEGLELKLKTAEIDEGSNLKKGLISMAASDGGFKRYLAGKGGMADLAGLKNEVDITNKLASTKYEDLLEKAKEYTNQLKENNQQGSNEYILLENIIESYEQKISQLKETNKFDKESLRSNNALNKVLDERKRILRENTQALEDFNRESSHRKKIREYQQQQADAALQGSGIYVTKQMQANISYARAQGEISSVRDDYKSRRMSLFKELNIEQDLQEKYSGNNLADIHRQQQQRSVTGIDAEMSKNRGEFDIMKQQEVEALQDKAKSEELKKIQESIRELDEQYKNMEETRIKLLETHIRENELIEEQQSKLQDLTKEEKEHVKAIEDGARARLKQLENTRGPGAFGKGVTRGMDKIREDLQDFDYQFGQQIPSAFADGLANAMSEGLSGAKDIEDALRDAGITFLQMIQKAMMQKAAMNIVGMMPFSRGGSVRKYNQGGGAPTGEGSVPAMVSNGEYVMNRDAVNKYGGSFMHGLNSGGTIPGFSEGGKLEGFRYKSGKAYQSKKMSGLFYGRKDHIGLKDDANLLKEELDEKRRREEEEVQRVKDKVAKKNALIKQAWSVVAGAVAAGAISKFSSFAAEKGWLGEAAKSKEILKNVGVSGNSLTQLMDNTGVSMQEATSTLHMAKLGQPAAIKKLNDLTGGQALAYTGPTRKFVSGLGKPMLPSYPSSSRNYGPEWKTPTRPMPWDTPQDSSTFNYGGLVRRYAAGGHISGTPGIDQIPAMLSEGEYVIKASSARQIGRPMLDRINAGKFNDGGSIEKIPDSSETSGSGGNTNNINISVNIEGGSVKGDSKTSEQVSGEPSGQESQGSPSVLADKIKQQVLSVIVEEQRPGGLLSE